MLEESVSSSILRGKLTRFCAIQGNQEEYEGQRPWVGGERGTDPFQRVPSGPAGGTAALFYKVDSIDSIVNRCPSRRASRFL